MVRPIETIENRCPKRGEVVDVDKGGALRSATHKVGRLEAGRDVPMDQKSRWIRNRDGSGIEMDQESGPVTGTYVYGVTEEETRPEEAIQALSETPAIRAERFEGVHRLSRA